MYIISTNVVSKVLKRTQLHEYHFSTNFTLSFHVLEFNFDLCEENPLRKEIHKKYQINQGEYQFEILSTK
jgi:hypothetical protein